MEYGLIGGRLGHSYSKLIHEMLCGYRYDLCPLPTEADARAFLEKRAFKAINVTLPYKRLVMEYCSFIDPRAKAIGAVNTVVNHNGLLYGYNTDYLGFAHLCAAHGVDFTGRTVLILGTGGTHNTTSAVARDKGAARILTVSRKPDPAKGELSYEEAVHSGAQIVINTTPAGMYPNVGTCNLDIAAMPGLEAVLDVVYNPEKTDQEAERLRQQMEQTQAATEQDSSQDEEPSVEKTSSDTSANPTLADENTSSAASHDAQLPSEYLLNSTVRLFHQMGQIFRDNAAPPSNPMGIRIDSKRRKKLMQKRLAMGHKQDDHEQNYGQTLQ